LTAFTAYQPAPAHHTPGKTAGSLCVLNVCIVVCLFFLLPLSGKSQQTPANNAFDAVQNIDADALDTAKPLPLPGRAAILSATLPGLGQAYNGAYWKIPIIYAGFGAVAYAVNFNNNEYQVFRKAYLAKVDGNPNTIDEYPLYSDAALKRAMDYYRRNLELSYILGVALYLLNILDANVQAHLMDFDVSEDLSMRLEPQLAPLPFLAGPASHTPGLKLTFRFKL